jgi:hypothetical protein
MCTKGCVLCALCVLWGVKALGEPEWTKHFQGRAAKPQISPLRCAPVEMTKGRVAMARRCRLSNRKRLGEDGSRHRVVVVSASI